MYIYMDIWRHPKRHREIQRDVERYGKILRYIGIEIYRGIEKYRNIQRDKERSI